MASGNSSNANRYKGEDIDSDGDGSVNDAQTLQGNQPNDLKSEIGENISLSEYRSEVNRSIRNDAQQNFELGLIKIGYPDGFYDVFVDESKIANKSNISVDTTNKFVKMVRNQEGSEIYTDSSTYSTNTSSFVNFKSFTVDDYLYSHDVVGDGDNDDVEHRVIFNYSDGNSFTTDSKSYGGSFSFLNPNPEKLVDSVDVEGKHNSGNQVSVSDQKGYKAVFPSNGSITSTVQDKGYSATEVTLTADYSLNGQSIDSIKVFDGGDNELASYTESEIGQSKSISTSRTDYYAKINVSGDGSDTPKINSFEVGLDNA